MGRRFEKKVTTDGAVTLHERYLYRGYLQIAAVDLLANTTKHAILWDPSQPTATRPLAIQQGGTWSTYAWDLTKNIIALFAPTGNLSTTYTYTPFGKVSVAGEVDQPIQWSSEYHNTELALIYYNYRYYNPVNGRWTRRDPIVINGGVNLYNFVMNKVSFLYDYLGNKSNVKCIDYYQFVISSDFEIRNLDQKIKDQAIDLASKQIAKNILNQIIDKLGSIVTAR